MRTKFWIVFAAIGSLALHGAAQTYSTGGHRDALLTTTTLRRLIIGADAVQMRRDVDFGRVTEELEVTRYAAFLGAEVLPWLTLYGTIGHVEADVGMDTLDNGVAGSVGLQGRLWKMDIRDPAFMAGRASLRTGAEYLYAAPDLGNWKTLTVGVQLHYELFTESIQTTERVPYSLGLYAGPIYSWLDGRADDALWGEDFEGSSAWGVAAGAELNISHNLLLAVGIEYVDHSTWSASLRYAF